MSLRKNDRDATSLVKLRALREFTGDNARESFAITATGIERNNTRRTKHEKAILTGVMSDVGPEWGSEMERNPIAGCRPWEPLYRLVLLIEK